MNNLHSYKTFYRSLLVFFIVQVILVNVCIVSTEARTRLLILAPDVKDFVKIFNDNYYQTIELSDIYNEQSANNIQEAFNKFIPDIDIIKKTGRRTANTLYQEIHNQFKYLRPWDSFIVYLNSHGFRSTNQDLYLIASNTTIDDPDKFNPSQIKPYSLNGYISREKIVNILKGNDTKNKTYKDNVYSVSCFLFIDSCYGQPNTQGAENIIPSTNFFYGISKGKTFFNSGGSQYSLYVRNYSNNLMQRTDNPPNVITLIDFITSVNELSGNLYFEPGGDKITEKYENFIIFDKPNIRKTYINLLEIKKLSETNEEFRNPEVRIQFLESDKKNLIINGFDEALDFFSAPIFEKIKLGIIFQNSNPTSQNYEDEYYNKFIRNDEGKLSLMKTIKPKIPYESFTIGKPEQRSNVKISTIKNSFFEEPTISIEFLRSKKTHNFFNLNGAHSQKVGLNFFYNLFIYFI